LRKYLPHLWLEAKLQTTYTRIMEALNFIKKEKIFREPRLLGQARAKSNLYELSDTITAFRKIFQNYRARKEIEKFLGSNYIRFMLDRINFTKVHKVIRGDLNDPKIKEIASKSLLNDVSTIEEYKKSGDSLRRDMSLACSDDLSTIKLSMKSEFEDYIKILNDYNPIDAISLYRKTFHMAILGGYENLASRGIITEGLLSFMAFDTYLSPLTSFPIRDIRSLLLLPIPFQRIYEDIYLLNHDAFEVLSNRAGAIYYHFSDILFELVKDEPFSLRQLKAFTKHMIFYWNVASTRFDLVCNQLAPFYKNDNALCYFNVIIRGDRIIIIDLIKKETMLALSIEEEMLSMSSNPRTFKDLGKSDMRIEVMINAFDYLRPCLTFMDMGWRFEVITLDAIFTDLIKKIQKNIDENVSRYSEKWLNS
jgi:hypothetical protein